MSWSHTGTNLIRTTVELPRPHPPATPTPTLPVVSLRIGTTYSIHTAVCECGNETYDIFRCTKFVFFKMKV